MQAATSTQPATATIGVCSHEGSAILSDRRRISAAAINPPANGSQALARNEKKDDPMASCWLAHKHHAKDRTAKACNAIITALIFDVAPEATRQTSEATNGIQM